MIKQRGKMAVGALVDADTGVAIGGGGGTPGGSDTQFQYNNATAFGGADSFLWKGLTAPGLITLGTNYSDVNSGTWRGIAIGGSDDTGFGATLILNSDSNDSSNPQIVTISSKGTIATPLANGSGDDLFGFFIYGYDSDPARRLAARIGFAVDAAPNSGHVPGRIVFVTDSTTGSAERMRISSTGLTTITGTLNVTTAYQANGTPGMTTTITTNSLVGKTITVTNGLITGFA